MTDTGQQPGRVISQNDVTEADKAAVTRFHNIQIKRIMAGDNTLDEDGRQTIEQAFAERRLAGFDEGRLTALTEAGRAGVGANIPPDEHHELVVRIAEKICLAVCELPDRTSPEDWPDACLVTSDELHDITTETLSAELSDYRSLAAAPTPPVRETQPFQARVQPWLLACFGEMIAGDREERNHRFLEEALELVQSCGCAAGEAHQLVDYVFGRPAGEPIQEVGGVMVTLAALCLANSIDMHAAAEAELARIWTKVEAIRAKQAAKPKYSPLPAATLSRQEEGEAR